MTAAPGNRGKRKPERRVPNATFRQLAVTRLNTVRALHPRSVVAPTTDDDRNGLVI